MKTKLLLILIAFWAGSALTAQNVGTIRYFGDGSTKEAQNDTTRLLVYFNKAEISIEDILSSYHVEYEEPHIIIDPILPPHPGINATPNPTDGHTTIGIDIDELPQNAMLVITDMYGNVVVREMLRGTSQEVDLSERPAGNYYVFVIVGDKMIGMNKIVVY